MEIKNKCNKGLMIFLAAAMSAAPLNAENVFKKIGNFLDNPKSVSIEYTLNSLNFENLKQANAEKDSLMSQYIAGWKALPNLEPRLKGIKLRNILKEEYTGALTASMLNSIGDERSYNETYNTPAYKSAFRNEQIKICEKKLGIEGEHYINEWCSYLVNLGFVWDEATYSRKDITIYSDDKSVTRDIHTSGSSRGAYIEGSLKVGPGIIKKTFAKNISVIVTGSLKSNRVGTSGTETATDSYDVSGNWEDSKNMDFDMTRADLNFEIRYSFGE